MNRGPICRKCKHHGYSFMGFSDMCNLRKKEVREDVDLVTGKITKRSSGGAINCDVMRSLNCSCGPNGNHFIYKGDQ